MDKIISFLDGKKTYIIAFVTFALAGVQALGYVVPDYVYGILGALGLGSLRAGVKSDIKNS